MLVMSQNLEAASRNQKKKKEKKEKLINVFMKTTEVTQEKVTNEVS